MRHLFTAAVIIAVFGVASTARAQSTVHITELNSAPFPFIDCKVKFTQQSAVIRHITQDRVQMKENGAPVAFTMDCPVSPVAFALVMDKSISMARMPGDDSMEDPDSTKWRAAKSAILSFSQQLQAPDVAELISFHFTVRREVGFISDGKQIADRLDGIRLGSGTSAWAACVEAINNLLPRQERKIVILLTDGVDTGSWDRYGITYEDLVRLALSNGIAIYTIGLADERSKTDLKRLADTTGGKFYFSADGSDLAAIYNEITLALSVPCTLRYVAADTCGNGTFRAVNITADLGVGIASSDTFYTAPYRKDTITFVTEMPGVIGVNQRLIRVPVLMRHTFRDDKQFTLDGDLHYPRSILRYERAEPTAAFTQFNVTVDTVSETIRFGVFSSLLQGNNDTLCYLVFSVLHGTEVRSGTIQWLNLESSRECQNVNENIVASFLVDGLCDKIVRKISGLARGTYPNPASGPVTIPIVIDERYASMNLTVSVKDQTGRVIEVLSKGMLALGTHRLTWNPGNLPNGSYWIELTGPGIWENAPVTVVK